MLEEFRNGRARRSEKTALLYECAVKGMAKRLGFGDAEAMIVAMKDGKLDPILAIDRYVQSLLDDKRAPKTVLSYFTAVKKFLEYEEVPFDERKLKNRVVLPQNYEVSSDRSPTNSELEKVFMDASLKAKTMVTVLASSGMRIGELQTLKIGQIDFSKSPTRINLQAKATKTRHSRFTFTSDEATTYLKAWLGKRIDKTDEYVFPMARDSKRPDSITNLAQILTRAFNRAGLRTKLDADSARYAVHPHCLRKFFFTKCLSVGIERGIVEGWMGHKFGLDGAYLRLGDDYLANEYQKAMPSLSVARSSVVNGEIGERVKQLETENMKLREELSKFGVKLSLVSEDDMNEQFRAWMSIPRKERMRLVRQILKA